MNIRTSQLWWQISLQETVVSATEKRDSWQQLQNIPWNWGQKRKDCMHLIKWIFELISYNVELCVCQKAVASYHHHCCEEWLWQQHAVGRLFSTNNWKPNTSQLLRTACFAVPNTLDWCNDLNNHLKHTVQSDQYWNGWRTKWRKTLKGFDLNAAESWDVFETCFLYTNPA